MFIDDRFLKKNDLRYVTSQFGGVKKNKTLNFIFE